MTRMTVATLHTQTVAVVGKLTVAIDRLRGQVETLEEIRIPSLEAEIAQLKEENQALRSAGLHHNTLPKQTPTSREPKEQFISRTTSRKDLMTLAKKLQAKFGGTVSIHGTELYLGKAVATPEQIAAVQ